MWRNALAMAMGQLKNTILVTIDVFDVFDAAPAAPDAPERVKCTTV